MLVGLGKSLAVIFQGAWLIQIAAVEFERELQLQYSCGGRMLCQACLRSCLREDQQRACSTQTPGSHAAALPDNCCAPGPTCFLLCRPAAVEH